MIQELNISNIVSSNEIQPRVQLDWLTLGEYAADMKAGDAFPPVVVFHDGENYWLADGFHRIEAAKNYAGLDQFQADVRQGSKRDARLYALGANKDRGLRLKNADKQRIVEAMLNDSEWVLWTDTQIARHCGVSSNMVGEYRKTIFNLIKDSNGDHRKTTRNGTTYTMNTAKIGKSKKKESAPSPTFDDVHATALTELAPQPTEDPQTPPALEPESAVEILCPNCGSSYSDWHDGHTDSTPHGKACSYMEFYGCADCRYWEEIFYDDQGNIIERNAGEDMPLYDDATSGDPRPTTEPPTVNAITIHNTDAQNIHQLNIAPVHLVITSPPYNVGIEYTTHNDNLLTYLPLLESVWRQCYDVMTEGARIAVVVPFGIGRNPWVPMACKIMETLNAAGFTLRGQIIWDKGNSGGRTSWGSFRLPSDPSLRDTTEVIIVAHKGSSKLEIPDGVKQRDDKGTYTPWLIDSDYFMELAQDHWNVQPESAQRIGHPAPFPVELVKRLIHFYAFPGAHILDPFAGSGTVGVTAKALGCDATLIEIDKGYCELAKERLNV